MWKCASRGLKSIFCKNQCFYNNVTTREARNNKSCNDILGFSPALFGHFNRSYGGEKKSKFSKKEKKENPKTEKGYCLHDLHNDLFGALQWSGIFVLGWYILQPLSHRRALFKYQPSETCAFSILTKFTCNEYLKLVEYLKSSVKPFHSVLPTVEAKNSKAKKCKSECEESKFEELEKAHLKVLGIISNLRGAYCMKHGKYSEAIGHFEDGAQVQNPAALFNLGVCHESGLGTNQDFEKAAELYKKAADLGHPTATYNLGVFYVHGTGGIKCDMNEARRLFNVAAKLGNQNAKEALDLENNFKQKAYEVSSLENPVNSSQGNNFLKKMSVKYGNFDLYSLINVKMDTNLEERHSEYDSGALDLSP